jgi:putative transposase
MKRKNFTAEQIIRVLREVDTGSSSVAQTCRRYGISEVTFYRWRKRYQGMNLTEAKRLKKLTAENARLKRMVADRELELDALKEILEKKR